MHFLNDGRITSPNPDFDAELNNILNLNVAVLVNARKKVLLSFQHRLIKRGTLTKQTWERLLKKWNGESHFGELTPFCSVIVYWIKKKLARMDA